MSKPARGSQATGEVTTTTLGTIKTEAEISQINRDVEKSIKNITKQLSKSYEKRLAVIESNVVKMTADAELRLTRTGKRLSEGYQEYISKISQINNDVYEARTKAEATEILKTIKTYKQIVKTTKALSKEEKKELAGIIKETTDAANLVRKTKLTNTRYLARAISNNLPDIAGIISSVFGDSLVPAFIGSVIGDVMRQRKEAKRQEEQRRMQLLKDERDFNIQRSIERRKIRDHEMGEFEKNMRKFTFTKDTGTFDKTKTGFFSKKRQSPLATIIKKSPLLIPNALTSKKSEEVEPQEEKTPLVGKKLNTIDNQSKTSLITGRELSVQARNVQRITKKAGRYDSGTSGEGPFSSSTFDYDTFFDLASETIEESVYTGVYDSMSLLANKGIFRGAKKTEEKFYKDQEKFKEKEDIKREDEQFKKEKKVQEDLSEQTNEILRKQQEDTAELARAELFKKIYNILRFVSENRDRLPRMMAKPLFALAKTSLFKKFNMDNIVRKIGGSIFKNMKKVVTNKWFNMFTELFREEHIEEVRHRELIATIKEYSGTKFDGKDIFGAMNNALKEILYDLDNMYTLFTNGITTIPINIDKYTPKEIKQLDIFKDIAGYIGDTFNAIVNLDDRMEKCLPCKEELIDGKTGELIECDDKCVQPVKDNKVYETLNDIRNGLGLSWQQDQIDSMDDKEERLDKQEKEDAFFDSMDSIRIAITEDGVVISKDSIKDLCDCLNKGSSNGIIDKIKNTISSYLPDVVKNVISKGPLKSVLTSAGGLVSGAVGSVTSGIGGLLSGTAGLLTGGLGLSGLLTSSMGTIASTGAGAMAGAGAAVGAAGLAGYGIGTIINKGIDTAIKKLTDGKNKTLGGWLYDKLHPRQVEKIKTATDLKELKAEVEDAKTNNNVELMSNAVSNNSTVVGGSSTTINMPVQPYDIDRATNQLVETYGA
jgi:hypothetical protein